MTSPTRFALVAVLLAGALAGGCGEEEPVPMAEDTALDEDSGAGDAAAGDVAEIDTEVADIADDVTVDPASDPDVVERPEVVDRPDVEDEPCFWDCFGEVYCRDGVVWDAPLGEAPCINDPCGPAYSTRLGDCASGCGNGHWCAEDEALIAPPEGAEFFDSLQARVPGRRAHETLVAFASSASQSGIGGDTELTIDVAWLPDNGERVDGGVLVQQWPLAPGELSSSWVEIRDVRYDLVSGTARLPWVPDTGGWGSPYLGDPFYTMLSIVGQTADGTTVSAGWGWTADGSYTGWALVEPAP